MASKGKPKGAMRTAIRAGRQYHKERQRMYDLMEPAGSPRKHNADKATHKMNSEKEKAARKKGRKDTYKKIRNKDKK